MLHQNEGGIGKSIPDAWEISQELKDFPRDEAQDKYGGSILMGWISQYLPHIGGVWTFSHHKSYPKGWIRKSIPG